MLDKAWRHLSQQKNIVLTSMLLVAFHKWSRAAHKSYRRRLFFFCFLLLSVQISCSVFFFNMVRDRKVDWNCSCKRTFESLFVLGAGCSNRGWTRLSGDRSISSKGLEHTMSYTFYLKAVFLHLLNGNSFVRCACVDVFDRLHWTMLSETCLQILTIHYAWCRMVLKSIKALLAATGKWNLYSVYFIS